MAMRALAREVVGRDEELAVVRDFLAAVDRLAGGASRRALRAAFTTVRQTQPSRLPVSRFSNRPRIARAKAS